jgi:predicted ATPase/DNA-binding CsgD family transcriptional regulator
MPPTVARPPLRPRAGFLPVEIDSFVGRRNELDEVRRLFTRSPLVTIVGPGGVGKTRLALRTAASVSRSFRDGVWLCELGQFHDPALVTQAMADALGVTESSTELTAFSLAQLVADTQLLLVLDNCEHLLEATALAAHDLLRTAPALRILATSREPLGVPGETTLRLNPLAIPDNPEETSAASVTRYDSVQLFIDRATTATADFELTDRNSRDVARICSQVDGVPLAIELAAARVRTLAPDQLADRLSDLFTVLTNGSRIAPSRHRTLRQCIDWSFNQCSEKEQVLWSRLSVFVGSFDLDAAEGICAGGAIQREEILDLVESLVDKSIVTREMRGSRPFFKLLESIRAYGAEQLLESAETSSTRSRHAAWYHQSIRTFEAELLSQEQASLAARIDTDLPNIREALDFSLQTEGQAAEALRSLNGMYLYWLSRGLMTEARYWLGRALGQEHVGTPKDRVVGHYTAMTCAGLQGNLDAARSSAAAALSLVPDLEGAERDAYAATIPGVLAIFEGDPERALAHFPAAIDGHHRAGDLSREVELLVAQGFTHAMAGDEGETDASHQRVLAITQPRGEIWWRATSLWALGLSAWRHGDPEGARNDLEQSLQLRRSMADSMGSVWTLAALALAHADLGDLERSAVLLGVVTSLTRAAGAPPSMFPELEEALIACEERIARTLSASAADRARLHGSSMDVAQATAFALSEPDPAPASAPSAWSVLTRRERQVAALVADGMSNREIAASLVISERTAEGHVENVLMKLACSSRTQIAAWVADHVESSGPNT